jgi:POT family proton-dependent oligopeptide transporter
MSEAAAPVQGSAPKGHPKVLYILFATEMWERFSYYGMRALLVLYLISYLEWQPARASGVYKWYTSLVYLTPLLGGWLADKKLGLRLSITIGGVLMAIGHFLMAFEPLPFFYSALGFLIMGNGFFKPNISTLVGKMYRPDDPRRDGAFTIFYMGINMGAFLAPLVCGQFLRKYYGFHAGFAAAGVGMVIGLVTYLLGQKQIVRDVEAAGNHEGFGAGDKKEEAKVEAHEPSEDQPSAPGFAGMLSKILPWALIALVVIVPALYLVQFVQHKVGVTDLIMPVAFSAVGAWMGRNLLTIRGAGRDKSSVIFILFLFTVLFWMAFEQAGNALNIWAEVNTDRHVFGLEYSAEVFQSVNPALIFALAPVFAALWLYLAKKSVNVSTPMKMFAAMVLMALSFLAMVGGAIQENKTVTSVQVKSIPTGVDVGKLNAGRLALEGDKLSVHGVLAPFAVTDALEKTLDKSTLEAIESLGKAAKNATKKQPVSQVIPNVGPSIKRPFDKKAEEENGTSWNAATSTISAQKPIDERTRASLIASAANQEWRSTLDDLAKKSEAARVGGIWLLLSYLLATLGELCLSPVGLSMVTKLAPARFASLFMGVWLLSSSVAQYVGGSIGESWGLITPTSYFMLFVWTSVAGAVVLFFLIKPLEKLMHGVD